MFHFVQVRENDLLFYESYNGQDVTDHDGPAMTWGMFAVGWIELGNMTKANELFERSFQNIQQPFQVMLVQSIIKVILVLACLVDQVGLVFVWVQ